MKNFLKTLQNCQYSSDLITKINLLNMHSKHKVDIMVIKKAIWYAREYHGSQLRQSGEPYYSHPLAVAEMVADYCFETTILVTAILHDVLEDTDLTKEMITDAFGKQIADNVEDLTRIKPYGKITAAQTIQRLWVEGKYSLLLIKYFDRVHNLQTISAKSPEKVNKIIEETLKQFISLAIYFEKSNIPNLTTNKHIDIVELCLKHYNNTKSREFIG